MLSARLGKQDHSTYVLIVDLLPSKILTKLALYRNALQYPQKIGGVHSFRKMTLQ